jgi:hypothetical protein
LSGVATLASYRALRLVAESGSHFPLEDRQARLSGAECGNIDVCVKILDANLIFISFYGASRFPQSHSLTLLGIYFFSFFWYNSFKPQKGELLCLK